METQPLADLDKQIKAKEQQLSILQTTAKASEDQWAVRKKQIADDTQITIGTSKNAIAKATEKAKNILEQLQKSIESAQEQFKKEQAEQHARIIESEQSIANLEHSKKVLSKTNSSLEDDNRTLESEIVVRQENVDTLKTAKESLSVSIAEMRVQQQEVEDQLTEVRIVIKTKSEELLQLEGTIKEKTDQFNSDISILEQKKQMLAQEIVENHSKDTKVRENLASWSKQLDERDKNLRIRETKVNDQEKAIVRNYNLLQL
jgi:chromosome segregation ATPase